MLINSTATSKSNDISTLSSLFGGIFNFGAAEPSSTPAGSFDQVLYTTTGYADIDAQNNIYRFNVTSLSYKKNGKVVSNNKPRATTLLMYDLLPLPYNLDNIYGYGMNFTWSSPACTCSPIALENGGGSVRFCYFFDLPSAPLKNLHF